MSKIIRLTEADLIRLVKRVINENQKYEEQFDFDIQQIDCDGEDMSYVDYDVDTNTIEIRYCDESQLAHLKKKGIRLAVGRFGSDYLNDFEEN